MANAVRRNQRDNRRNTRYTRASYVDGNTARKVQTRPRPVKKKQEVQTVKVVSQKAKRNREKATSTSPGFVVFLAVVCVAILFTCVNYLQMKSEITGKAKTLANLEAEYSQLKADNDAYYSQVSSSADMEKIKAIAIRRLGMKYASEDQIITYETERSSYVRQYQDVPDADR